MTGLKDGRTDAAVKEEGSAPLDIYMLLIPFWQTGLIVCILLLFALEQQQQHRQLRPTLEIPGFLYPHRGDTLWSLGLAVWWPDYDVPDQFAKIKDLRWY